MFPQNIFLGKEDIDSHSFTLFQACVSPENASVKQQRNCFAKVQHEHREFDSRILSSVIYAKLEQFS